MAITGTFIIAILALVVSVANLIWNILARFLHPKARMRVTVVFNTSEWVELGVGCPIALEIVNFGPTDCVLQGVALVDKVPTLFDKSLNYWFYSPKGHLVKGGNSFSEDQVWPRLLKSGELCHVELPVLSAEYGPRKPIAIGFLDTFARVHTVEPSQFFRVRDVLKLPK
jgi:hypothetical protein